LRVGFELGGQPGGPAFWSANTNKIDVGHMDQLKKPKPANSFCTDSRILQSVERSNCDCGRKQPAGAGEQSSSSLVAAVKQRFNVNELI
jgi:hypothetical protein